MLFRSVCLKMHEKKLLIFKMAKIAFLVVYNFFFGAFSKTPNPKNNCVFIVFNKAESEAKHEENFFLGVFLQKPKICFFGGENKIVLKLKFKICISAFVLYCKRKLYTNFLKIILIFN